MIIVTFTKICSEHFVKNTDQIMTAVDREDALSNEDTGYLHLLVSVLFSLLFISFLSIQNLIRWLRFLRGIIRSLNVHVLGAMAIWEHTKQKMTVQKQTLR
jgi:hypothetical protein